MLGDCGISYYCDACHKTCIHNYKCTEQNKDHNEHKSNKCCCKKNRFCVLINNHTGLCCDQSYVLKIYEITLTYLQNRWLNESINIFSLVSGGGSGINIQVGKCNQLCDAKQPCSKKFGHVLPHECNEKKQYVQLMIFL